MSVVWKILFSCICIETCSQLSLEIAFIGLKTHSSSCPSLWISLRWHNVLGNYKVTLFKRQSYSKLYRGSYVLSWTWLNLVIGQTNKFELFLRIFEMWRMGFRWDRSLGSGATECDLPELSRLKIHKIKRPKTLRLFANKISKVVCEIKHMQNVCTCMS